MQAPSKEKAISKDSARKKEKKAAKRRETSLTLYAERGTSRAPDPSREEDT